MRKRLWIEDRLKQLPGKTKSGLARALMDDPEDARTATVHEMISGKRKRLSVEEIGRMAAYLEWSAEIILEMEGLGSDDNDGPMVPVVGYVGAGAAVEPVDPYPKGAGLKEVPCPRGLNPLKTVAVIVRGESQEPTITDGWLIFYSRDPEPDAAAVVGKLSVVKVADGPVLLKQVRRGHKNRIFNLLSANAPMVEGVALEWAAPVLAILPPSAAQEVS